MADARKRLRAEEQLRFLPASASTAFKKSWALADPRSVLRCWTDGEQCLAPPPTPPPPARSGMKGLRVRIISVCLEGHPSQRERVRAVPPLRVDVPCPPLCLRPPGSARFRCDALRRGGRSRLRRPHVPPTLSPRTRVGRWPSRLQTRRSVLRACSLAPSAWPGAAIVRALSSFPLRLWRLRFRPPEPLWVFAADCPSVSWPHGLARARDECSRLPCLQSRGDGARASPRVLTMSKSTLRDPPAPRSRLPIDPPCGGQAGPVPSSNFTCSRAYS